MRQPGRRLGTGLPVAEAVADAYEKLGLETRLQYLSATSANVIGELRASAQPTHAGPSLILNSHLDTEGVVPDADDDERRRLRGTWREGDLLIGKGLINAKVHLVTQLAAVAALVQAGVSLGGDVILTGVAQESGAPIREETPPSPWIGPHMDEGTGARRLVARGTVADYALVGEPTGLTIATAQAGYLRVRITITGFVPYTPFIERGPLRTDNPNPFERSAPVIAAISEWAERYAAKHSTRFEGGTIVPKAQIQDLRSGSVAFTDRADVCHIYVDVRLSPEDGPVSVTREVHRVVTEVEPSAEVVPYDYRRGYIAHGAESLVDALRSAHTTVFGSEPSVPHPSQTSMWQDTNVFNEAGIPSVSYGIRPVAEEHTREGIRAARIDDIVGLAKVYVLAVASISGTEAQRGLRETPAGG